MIFDPGMVPLDPERDFHQNGCIFMPVASIWACFEQKRILRNLVYVSWSVHQIIYFLEIMDLMSKKKFKPQEMIEMDHLEGGLNFFFDFFDTKSTISRKYVIWRTRFGTPIGRRFQAFLEGAFFSQKNTPFGRRFRAFLAGAFFFSEKHVPFQKMWKLIK